MILKRKLFAFFRQQQPMTPEQQQQAAQQQALAQQQQANMAANNYTNFDSKAADVTAAIGKAGMLATAGLGAATAWEGGRAIYDGVQAGKEAKKLAEAIKKDPSLLEALKKGGSELSDQVVGKLRALGIPVPKGDSAVMQKLKEKVGDVGGKAWDALKTVKDNTKFSKYDKAMRYWGYLNNVTDNTSRMVLNSAGNWAGLAVNGVTDKLLGGVLQSPEENKAMSNILSGAGHKFNTEAERSGFLEKLKSSLSPEEFNKVQKSLGGKKGAKFSEEEVKNIMSKLGPKISENAAEKMRMIPKIIGKAGTALGHFKNAKGLAKATAGVAGVAGLAYYNGKSFQDFRNNARNTDPNAILQQQQVAQVQPQQPAVYPQQQPVVQQPGQQVVYNR